MQATTRRLLNALGEVVMDDSFPSGNAQTTVYGQDNDGAAPAWSITARSLCADA